MILTVMSSVIIETQAQQQTDRNDGTLRRLQVPILMYHYVGNLPADADEIRVRLTVSGEMFREHIAYLADNGYQSISLYEMEAALNRGAPLPEKPVVLTFDDGYIDHYQTVFPILRDYGFTGTFFIVTQFVDENHANYMNWAQIQEMAAAGMSIEAHTKTHINLRNRSHDELAYQIIGSIESIEAHIGQRPRIFSYPAGRYDHDTLDLMETTDVLLAVTTRSGTWHNSSSPLELARMRVSHDTGVNGLRYLLTYQSP